MKLTIAIICLLVGYVFGVYLADSRWQDIAVEKGHAQVVEGEWMWSWECPPIGKPSPAPEE